MGGNSLFDKRAELSAGAAEHAGTEREPKIEREGGLNKSSTSGLIETVAQKPHLLL